MQLDSLSKVLAQDTDSLSKVLAQDTDSLSKVLAQSVSSLTEAYQSAIVSAIEESEGRISEKIAKDIAAANKVLEDRIAAIENRVTALENWKKEVDAQIAQIDAQIENLISRVQSIAVVPQYSDGSVDIYDFRLSDIDIEISPSSVAKQLVKQGASVFSMAAVYTETKAVNFIDIPVEKVSYDNGVVTLSVDGSVLSESFFSGSQTASARIAVSAGKTDIKSEYFSIQGISDKVDLGLSVKWATCNLGASAPEEYGLYYQWGDTEGYGSDTSDGKYFDWTDYKWCEGTDNTLTKYNSDESYGYVDNLSELEADDDAASAALGGSWRMPTAEECQELIDNCTWTWTTLNGINGVKCQSEVEGYTDRWIFLPAAGLRFRSSLLYYNTTLKYFSKSIGQRSCWASATDICEETHNEVTHLVLRLSQGTSRFCGLPIRPVSD